MKKKNVLSDSASTSERSSLSIIKPIQLKSADVGVSVGYTQARRLQYVSTGLVNELIDTMQGRVQT
jgi:hypothetical protein